MSQRECLLCAGVSGSGKTTAAIRYLLNADHYCARFLWDPDGQFSERLALPAATTGEDLEASLADGWSIFDPNELFPGRHAEGFAWFASWAFAAAGRGPGQKILVVDEVWKYCAPSTIPAPLAECIQTGRVRGLDCLFCTQRPNRLNESITNEVTQVIAFRVQGRNALAKLEELGVPESVANLPRFAYLAVSCESGAVVPGRL